MTILNRLRSAESGSRELDARIWCEAQSAQFLCWAIGQDAPFGAEPDMILIKRPDRTEGFVYADIVTQITTSIDAALFVVQEMLPCALWRVEQLPLNIEPKYWATVGKAGEQEAAYGKTAPLAILTALFTALEAKDTP